MRDSDRSIGRETAAALLRLALAAGLVSGLADRFGLWGPPLTPGVRFGDFAAYEAWCASMSPWTPLGVERSTAWALTSAEAVLATMLLAGVWTRFAALLAGILLLAVALATTLFVSAKAALDASLFTSAAAAFLLAAAGIDRWSLDERRARLRRWLANAPA